MRVSLLGLGFCLVLLCLASGAPAPQAAALILDGTIALPDTAGRIDHLAVDLARRHLFVAELGNGTVDVIDLGVRKVVHRIAGLKEPQGLAYDPKSDLLAVASGSDGTLRLYAGQDFIPRGVMVLGDDADNVRVDPRNGHVIVGYGGGALAVIDPVNLRKIADIALPGHPESFRLEGSRVFVNVPDAGQVVVADLASGKIAGQWRPLHAANFPMILDDAGHLAIAFRSPSRLSLIDQGSGAVLADLESCGDADDLFYDAGRKRYYVSCGSGAVDIVGAQGAQLRPLSQVATSWGARTSLFVPELDRLFVAERAGLLGSNAAIAIFRPQD